ncbi:hypothetical protein P691DRAFT_622074, partial [Macrolepiota fuliginosa MF-IS2]
MDLVDDPSCPSVIAVFELPGVKNENITLQIKDRRLVNAPQVHSNSTKPSTRTPNAGPSTAQPIRELRYGPFYRTITIPDGIKQSEVTAGIQDGMLTVTWPRVPA